MPDPDSQTRQALSRARWAILQTGLITSALALFGVYVLGCRDIKSFLMDWSIHRWIAVGPLLVGAVCASGYLIGAYWTGLPIRGWLFAGVLMFQLLAFVGAHYAQFATRQLYWRDTQEPVPFTSYAKFVVQRMGADYDHPYSRPSLAYSLTASQVIQFSLVALLSPLVLMRHRRCPKCGGTVQQRLIGSIASASDIPRLTHFATLGDAGPLRSLLQPKDLSTPNELKVMLNRCVVCHQGQLIPATEARTPIDASRKLVQTLWTPPATS